MDKKNVEVTENEVVEAEATSEDVKEAEKIVVPVDPFSETVTKTYPFVKDEDDFIYAEVNGKGYKVKRGIPVDVPKPIAEVIDNKLKMEFVAYSFIEKNKNQD